MIASVKGFTPKIHKSVFVAPSADVMGDVTIGEHSSIWFQSVLRGDVHWIRIGSHTNIQDGCVLHVTNGQFPLSIGSRVTVGHKACLHGCTIEDDSLIGMGSVVLDNAIIRSGSMVAAGALVTPGKDFPSNSLIKGSPAKAVRTLTPEERTLFIEEGWQGYCANLKDFQNTFQLIES